MNGCDIVGWHSVATPFVGLMSCSRLSEPGGRKEGGHRVPPRPTQNPAREIQIQNRRAQCPE
jgi:hypothetical protein